MDRPLAFGELVQSICIVTGGGPVDRPLAFGELVQSICIVTGG